jgi:hypothetical protein
MNTGMLKAVAWFEIVASIILLGFAGWPFSGFCSGRFMGLDCESRAIFGLNMFGPLGILMLICSVWSLKTKSVVPQFVLVFGVVAIMLYWLSYAL